MMLKLDSLTLPVTCGQQTTSHLTLIMTKAKIVKISITDTDSSSSEDYSCCPRIRLHIQLTVTSGFKPFNIKK